MLNYGMVNRHTWMVQGKGSVKKSETRCYSWHASATHIYCTRTHSLARAAAGVTVDPHRRQLHLTMSHQYTPEHHTTLEELARSKIDPQAPGKWELRLYSRDPRQGSSEVSTRDAVTYCCVVFLLYTFMLSPEMMQIIPYVDVLPTAC